MSNHATQHKTIQFSGQKSKSVLPHRILKPHRIIRLLSRVPIPTNKRRPVHPRTLVIIQLKVKHSHEHRGNNTHLKLGEPHAQARVPSHAPPDIPKRLLLVLGAVGEIPAGVPLLGVRVDLAVEVDVVDPVQREAVAGHDLARAADGDVAARDVLAEGGAHQLEADGLAQGEVDQGELGLPVVEAERRQHLGWGLAGRGAVLGQRGVHLGLDPGVPLGVGG